MTKTFLLIYWVYCGIFLDNVAGVEKGLLDTFYKLGECFRPPAECPNKNISFWLYTRATQDKPVELDVTQPESWKGYFLPDFPLKILIHGYKGHRDFQPSYEIRPALLQFAEFNVISLDFHNLVKEPCYITAASNIELVGNCTAHFIDLLVANANIPLSSIHVIGFSLGAHVAGQIANFITSGQLERISGLDPALPLFVTLRNSRKLDKTDAKFVDIMHTDAMMKGKLEPTGHVDFYVNGGMNQLGCSNDEKESTSGCNHARAPLYYAESISSDVGFWGRRCVSWILYKLGWCSLGIFHTDEQIMGEFTPNSASGQYFLKTNQEAPFARGNQGAEF